MRRREEDVWMMIFSLEDGVLYKKHYRVSREREPKRKKRTAFGYGASSSSSSSFFSADSFAHAWSKIFSLRRSFRATRRRFAETAAVPDALAAASSSDVVKSSAMEVAE